MKCPICKGNKKVEVKDAALCEPKWVDCNACGGTGEATVTGKRVDNPKGIPKPGDYGKHEDGTWYCMSPNSMLGNLSKHTVIEHQDGTITVCPSILIKGHDGSWHGFLTQGIWREC